MTIHRVMARSGRLCVAILTALSVVLLGAPHAALASPRGASAATDHARRGHAVISRHQCRRHDACESSKAAKPCREAKRPARCAHKRSSKKHVIKMKLFGTSVSSLLTDGRRWAIYVPAEGVTRIIDTKTGRSEERADPEGCASLEAIGGGELLYGCGDPECPEEEHRCVLVESSGQEHETVRYEVADLATGVTHVVAGLTHIPAACACGGKTPLRVGKVGVDWLEMYASSDKGYVFASYLNWHTGETVDYGEEPVNSPRELLDLSSPSLVQRLCQPLRQVRNEEVVPGQEVFANGTEYRAMLYAPPLAIGAVTMEGKPVLQHCGSRRQASLAPGECGKGHIEGELGAGVLSCDASSVVPKGALIDGVGYVTHLSPRRYPWHGAVYHFVGIPQAPTPNDKPGRMLSAVQHTATMVFATMEETASEPRRIYAARLPWAGSSKRRASRRRKH